MSHEMHTPSVQRESVKSQEHTDTQDDESSSLLQGLPLFQWKSFWIFFFVCLTLALHWFSTSELFEIPQDVQATREKFVQAKDSYLANSNYWDAKLNQCIQILNNELMLDDHHFFQRIQEMPPEIFISFLLTKLGVTPTSLDRTAIYPRNDSSFSIIASKQESGLWPLKIMLSMELEITHTLDKFSVAISRLRRGSQDITLGLAWAYFGAELQSLRSFETESTKPVLVTIKD